jgi:hypothetical protein
VTSRRLTVESAVASQTVAARMAAWLCEACAGIVRTELSHGHIGATRRDTLRVKNAPMARGKVNAG